MGIPASIFTIAIYITVGVWVLWFTCERQRGVCALKSHNSVRVCVCVCVCVCLLIKPLSKAFG